ncbi:copper resistance CopC/CopD family protein [Paenirhodobacter populi]|uniref:Copper resistance protein CopC n=1 Tax=Paenirhodobacter populi TaxID=2306993 RepID=A0A451GBZ4_9RHOB|nr:CopD family protein [Sinirhodobacter populi]RWR12647.1 copper resistance protein CopC [Sinirhodobacter populi]
MTAALPCRRVGGWFLAGFAVALLWLVPAGQAVAHASLVSAAPPDGVVLEAAPRDITLTFNERVRPLAARLSAPDGRTVLLPPPEIEGHSLRFALPEGLARGSHLLSWRVTSADGHPLAGAQLFSVEVETAIAEASDDAPLATRAGVWALRAALIGALLCGVGGAVFQAFAGRQGTRFPQAAAGAGLALLLPVAGFQGLDLLGLPPAALLTEAPWREGVAGAPGLALALSAGALIAALTRPGRRIALVGLLACGMAAAAAGHAATAPPQAVMRPAVAAHVIAAALWIGALVPLSAQIARGGTGALAGFSRAIPWGVAVLAGSGVAIAVVQLGADPAALWRTDYGRVLLAKLALVGLLLAVALFNRLRLTPRAERGETRPLRRAIAVEMMLAAAIIGVIALWRFTPPPRAIVPVPPALAQEFRAGGLSAVVHVDPPRMGMVRVRVSDLRLDGAPFVPQSVAIEFSKPSYGLGPFRHEMRDGEADAGRFLLPLDGYWVVTVTVLISDFRAGEMRDIIEIRPAN